MKNKSRGMILAFGIIILFVVSAMTPIIGYDIRTTDEDMINEKYGFVGCHPYELSNYNYNSEAVDLSKETAKPVLIENEVSSHTAISDGLMDSAWPMKCHDVRHTSQSPHNTSEQPENVEKWRFKCEEVESSAVLEVDGTIYFGDMGTSHRLFALNFNGTKKWHYETGSCIWSTPAIAEDGTIYVGSYDHYLHAINPDGTRKWKFCAYDSISSSPVIAEDGTIYFGTMGFPEYGGCNIFAVNPNGTEKWRYQTGYKIVSDPAIGDDGTIYIGSGDTYLYALYPNGTLCWRFKTGGEIHGHPSIAGDDTIYIPSYNGNLYAVYPNNGTLKWEVHTGYGSASSAAISEDGTLYIGTDRLYAIYPNNGTIKWTLDVGGDILSATPAISADGTIYVSTGTGKSLVAVNPDGTEKWRKQICNLRADSSPIIGEDGTIYVGSSWKEDDGDWTGYLHAFGRGELIVDAGGPYSGDADEEIQFTGTVFGGIPEYSYHWDFGDGNISDEECPLHSYGTPGEYIATFTVIDGEENSSSDTANVTVGTARPVVRILKPENGLYLFNIRVLPLSISLIIGRINIKVEAYQEDVGIEKVEFYIDHELRYTDYDEPYSWMWNERAFFNHRIAVYAISNDGKSDGAVIEVWKFF